MRLERLCRRVSQTRLCGWRRDWNWLSKCQGEQRNLKNISNQLSQESDLVFAIATPSAQSIANTSKRTPVVFSAVTDPLAAKLVKNLDRPGGNVTGTSDQSSDAMHAVDLIQKVLPTAKTIGILYTQSEPNSVVQKRKLRRSLRPKATVSSRRPF